MYLVHEERQMVSESRVMTQGPDHAWYENVKAPIIIMHFPDRFGDEELDGALKAVQHWLLKEVDAPFSFIADMRRPLSITSKQRKMMADYEQSYVDIDRRFNAGQAVIVSNPITRGFITAIYWMSPPIYPTRIVGSMSEALHWLEPHFERALKEFPAGPVWTGRRRRAPSAEEGRPTP